MNSWNEQIYKNCETKWILNSTQKITQNSSFDVWQMPGLSGQVCENKTLSDFKRSQSGFNIYPQIDPTISPMPKMIFLLQWVYQNTRSITL